MKYGSYDHSPIFLIDGIVDRERKHIKNCSSYLIIPHGSDFGILSDADELLSNFYDKSLAQTFLSFVVPSCRI